jgi:hypothetical protein
MWPATEHCPRAGRSWRPLLMAEHGATKQRFFSGAARGLSPAAGTPRSGDHSGSSFQRHEEYKFPIPTGGEPGSALCLGRTSINGAD